MSLTPKEAEMKKDILTELGEPTIKVEIDDTAWPAIIKNAKRWFKAKKGVLDCAVVPVTPGKVEYDFPANACVIIDVILPQRSDINSLVSLGFFDIVPLNALNIGSVTSAFNSYSSYVQILQALETRRRVFSADPSYEILCNKIVLTNACNSSGTIQGQMLIVFKKEEWSVDELKDRDENLFYRYLMVAAKMVLGRIRSKYGSYPAAGGMIDTDGAELLAEAKEEKELLDEEIAESAMPMGILYG